jgi:carbamoyltransferase
MNVLGISGLPNCVSFKKKHFPLLENRHYRIAQGFDSAAALIIDNQIMAAAAEERFTRIKATECLPVQSIQFCLQQANLTIQDIDYIAHGFCYDSIKTYYQHDPFDQLKFNETYSRESLLNPLKKLYPFPEKKLIQVPHHLAHAASAFYLSGMQESLILVADGMGEAESMTIALGDPHGMKVLAQIPASHSLGIFYSVFTLYLGFEFNLDEYKVMGLAAYGDKSRYFNEIMKMIHLKEHGMFTIPILSQNHSLEEQETYAGTLKNLVTILGDRREPGAEITQHHMDIAAALQATLETVLIHVLTWFKQKTGQNNLCMAGGVALNCTANGYIRKSRLFKNIFIQPASGDEGTALGAALHIMRSNMPEIHFQKMEMPFFGPQYDNHEIKTIASQYGYQLKKFADFNILAAETAKRIVQGQIVGFFQGRMELGPRALGNRSILADPRQDYMRHKINTIIKKREDFRPFAPAVIAEQAPEFFEIDEKNILEYKHMVMLASVREPYKNILPAVIHINGTARVQTVFRSECPKLWEVINEFGKITKIPILLNTSFNVGGQPIVCTPLEAMETFATTELDSLVIGDYLLEKNHSENH